MTLTGPSRSRVRGRPDSASAPVQIPILAAFFDTHRVTVVPRDLPQSPTPSRAAGAPDTRFVADPFAGGALRVVRRLLIDPGRPWSIAKMADRTGLTLGFVSRTFKTLARDAYLERVRGATRLTDRDALLDAWAAAPTRKDSAFERVATVGGPEALFRLIPTLTAPSPYAVTVEAAADKLAPFARFSRAEIYVTDVAGWDRTLALTPVPRGSRERRQATIRHLNVPASLPLEIEVTGRERWLGGSIA